VYSAEFRNRMADDMLVAINWFHVTTVDNANQIPRMSLGPVSSWKRWSAECPMSDHAPVVRHLPNTDPDHSYRRCLCP
jgi:hypothetical protein